MKKKIIMLVLGMAFLVSPSFAAPAGGYGGGGPAMHSAGGGMRGASPAGHIAHRPIPPMYRPYRPFYYGSLYYPYYYSYYYPSTYYTTYSYYPTTAYDTSVEAVPVTTETVVVKDDYAGVNAAANIINAAANVASTVKYLSW
jgi:hypothetical protein